MSPAGDTQPCPAKQGTLAARWSHSRSHVSCSFGIHCNAVDASQASTFVPALESRERRSGSRFVGRREHETTTAVVHRAAADLPADAVLPEPEALVGHAAQEVLVARGLVLPA